MDKRAHVKCVEWNQLFDWLQANPEQMRHLGIEMDIEAEEERGLMYGQTWHINLMKCPFIDLLVSNTVFHLTGRADELQV